MPSENDLEVIGVLGIRIRTFETYGKLQVALLREHKSIEFLSRKGVEISEDLFLRLAIVRGPKGIMEAAMLEADLSYDKRYPEAEKPRVFFLDRLTA